MYTNILSLIDYEDKTDPKDLISDPEVIISGIDELKIMEANLSKPNKLPG